MGITVIGLPKRKRWKIEPKYQIIAACFLATFVAYVERVGFSISFTAMAKAANLDESVKGTVLSAFYWGYALSQVRTCAPSSHNTTPCTMPLHT
jgi:sugar phosphate permease